MSEEVKVNDRWNKYKVQVPATTEPISEPVEEEEVNAVTEEELVQPKQEVQTVGSKWQKYAVGDTGTAPNMMTKPAGPEVVSKAVTQAKIQQPDKNKLPAVPKEIADFKPDPEAERMIGEGDIAANTGLYAFMRSRTNDYYGSVEAVGKLEKEIDEKAVQFESTYKQQVEVLKQQISAESSKIEAEFVEKQQKAKEKYESSVKTAETEKEKKLITDSYNSEIQTIQAGYEAKINDLNINVQKQAEKIDTDYASSIEKLNTEAQGWDYEKEKEASKVLMPDQVKTIKEEIKGMPKDYDGRKKALNRYVNNILDSYDGTDQYDQVKEELYGIIRDEVLFDKDNQPTPYALKNQAEIEKRSMANEFTKLKQEYDKLTIGLRQRVMLSSQGIQMYNMMLEKIPGAKEKQQRLAYLERAIENYDRISKLPESFIGGEKTGSYFEGMAGVKNVISNTLTAGLIGALESEEMLKLAQKQKHGQPLTKDEQRFLDSVVLLETTTKIMNPGFTNWYKAGRATAESLPWITNMMATGGAYNAAKLATMRVLKSTGYRAAKKWTAKAIGKTVAAEAVGSAARIPFQPSLVENVVEGIIEPGATWGSKGLEGKTKETGRSAAGAVGRAVYMQWAENFSEISGTYITAAGKRALAWGAKKAGIKAFSAPKITKIFSGMKGKFSDVTKISNIPAEYAEEVMANALHLVDGTTTLESMTDFEENWVTFLSVATMVGGMQVASGTLKGIGSTISGEELAEGIAEYFSPEQVIEIDKISALGDLNQKASALSDFIQQNKVAGADPLQELARYVWDGQVKAGATAAASPEPGLPDTLPKYMVGEKPSDEETVKELIGDAKTPDQLAGIKIENNPEMELELSTKFKTLQENEKFTAALEGVTDQGEIDKITEAHTVALEKIDEEREAGLAKIEEKTQTVKPEQVEKLAETEEKKPESQQVEEKEVTKSEQKKTTVKPAEPSFQTMREELGVTDTKVQESMEGDVFSGRVKFVDVILAAGKKAGEVVIESMRTPKLFRQMGRATKALAKITEAADKQGITLRLIAKPEEKSGVTEEQLINFYKKNGFKFKEGSNEGVRTPWDPNIAVNEQAKKEFERLSANAEGALPSKWVATQDDLPKNIRDKAMSENPRLKKRGSIDGVYDPKSGKVYFVADQINSKDDVARVWLHEQVGHHGIDLVYPNKKDRDAFHEEVFRSVGFDKIRKVVSPSETRIFEGSDKGAKARIRLADEYVAYLTNKVINKEKLTVEEKSAWQKILDIVRKAWAKLYGNAPVNTLSDDDIARVLNKALAEVYKKKGAQDAKEDGRGSEEAGKKEGIDGGKEERLHIRDDERGGLEAEEGEKIRFSFQEKFPLFETLSKKGRLYGYNRKQVVRYLRDNVNDFKDVKTAQKILNIPDGHPAVRILEQAFNPSPEIYTMPTDVSSRLTTDENGDYVFHHYRSVRREKIDPKMSGKRPDTFTNSQEIGAMGDVGGENFYYTEEGQRESQAGNVLHTIVVPKEKVYFINEDYFDFISEARQRHEKLHGKGGIEFSPNHQVAQITKIAQEHGFDMTVSEWEGSGLRGQSVTEKVPQDKDIPLKERQIQFKVGMLIDDGRRPGKITDIDSKWVSYEVELYPGQMFQYDIPTWEAAKTLRIVSVADTEARSLPFELTTEIRSEYKVKYNWLKRALMNSGMGEFEANRLIVERVSARLAKELPEILKQEGYSGKVSLVPSIGGYNGETGYAINPNIRLSFEDIEDDLLLSLMYGLNLAGVQQGANAFRSPTKKELSEGDKGIHGMLTFVKPFRLDQDGFIEMMTELAGILDENGDAPFAGFTDFGEFIGMAGHFYESGGGDFHKEYEKNEDRIESILDEYGVEKGSIAFVYKKIFDYDENFSGRSRQTVRTVTQKIRDERGDNSQTERIFRQASDIFASEFESIGDGVGRNKRGRTGRQGLEPDEAVRFSVLTLPEKNATAIRGNPAFISNAFEHLKVNKFPTNYDFKLWSQKEFKKYLPALRKVYGRELTPGVFNKAMADYMSDQLLVEARLALTEHPKAVGWYDEQTKRCISIMGEIYPELLSDIDSQTAFITALAITSNGNKVRANLSYADRQYQSFKETGRFDAEMEMGTSQSAIRETLKIINGILDDGITIKQIREFFLTKYRVGDLKYTKTDKGKTTKQSLVSKRLVSDEVYGAIVVGPKVGNGFWMNLFGEFSQLTIDRWGMATFGRILGRSVIVDKEKTDVSYQEAVEALSGVKSNPKVKAAMEAIIGSVKGMTDRNIITSYYKATVKKENRDLMEKVSQLERMRLKANVYFVNLYNSILAPKNGSEWRFFEKAFDNTISRLRSEGINLTVADAQALFWYQEKVLFDYSKSKKDLAEIKKEYEEDAAPNFGNAASELARSRGVDSGRIEQARANADRVREFQRRATGIVFEGVSEDDKAKLVEAIGRFKQLGKAEEDEGGLRLSMAPETVIEKAKKYFGITQDFKEVGYIAPDGSMLDFSGKKFGGSPGRRTMDHAEIGEMGVSRKEFMNMGNIRIYPEVGGINLMAQPTTQQRVTLQKFIQVNDGNIYVDFNAPNSYYSEHVVQYDKQKASKVLGDIDNYYLKGIKPISSPKFADDIRFSEQTPAESLIQQSLRRLVKGNLITKGERATLADKLKDFIAAAPTTKKPQELADEAYAFLNELLKIKFLKRQEKELEAGFKGKMKEQNERQKMIAKNLKELSSIITQALGNIRRDEKQMITPGQHRAIINRLGNADTVRKMQALLDYVFDTVILGRGAKYKAELAIAKKWQGKIGDKNGGEKSQFGSAREIADRVENIDLKELSYEELQEFSEIASGMFLSQRSPSIAHLTLLDHRFGDIQKVKKEKEEPTPESATEIIEAVGKMDTQDIVDIPSYLTFRRRLNSYAKKIKELFADMNPDLAQELEEQYELEIDGIEEMVNKQLEAFMEGLENFRKAHAVHLARRLKQKETRDGAELLETQEERDAANELIDTQTKDIMDLDINLLAELETAINNLREGHITPAFFDIKRAVRISHKKRLTFLPGFDIVGKDKTGIWARRRKKGGRRGVQTLVPKSLRKNDLFKELVRQFKSKQPFRIDMFLGIFDEVKKLSKAYTETGRAITLAETDKQKFDKAAGIAYQEFQKGKTAKEQERWRKWIFLYKAMIRWQNSKYAEKNPNLFHMVFEKLYEVERTKVDDPTGFDEDAAYYKTFMDFMREKGGLTAPDAEGVETLNEAEADRVMREDAGVAALLDWSDKIVEQYKGMNKVSALYNGRSLIWGDFYVPFMRKYKNDNLESESNIESWINRSMFNANFVAGSTYEWSGNPMYMEMDIMRVMSLYSEMMRRNYFIYPELRENVTALKEAARAVSREIIEKNADRKDNDIYLLGRALAEGLRSRISSYYNSNYMIDQSVILKKAEVAIKKTMLVKIEKFLSEFSVNISRIMLATMNIPAADLERLVKKYDFWGNEINSWVNKGMWSAYSTEINYKLIGSVLGSGWVRRTAKGAEQVADWMIKAPDMGAGRILFVHSMTRKFKELTGEEFSEDKWKESRSYRQKWSDAKEESMYFANTRVEELFNSKNPLSEGELKSFLGGLLKADRRNAMARSFSMLMSFGQNDSNQIADSFRRIRHGGPKARLRAVRDINALFMSNFMYAVVRAWAGVMAYQHMYKPIFDSISDTLIASVATPGGGDDEWEKVMEEIEAKDEEYMDKKANVFKKGDYYLDLLKFRIGPDFLLGGSSNIVEYGGKWLVWAYDRTYGLSDDTRQAISDAFYQRYIMLIPHTWNDPEKTIMRVIPPMWETAFEDALSFAYSLKDFTRGHIATSIIGAVFDVEESGGMTKKEVYDILNLWFTASKYLMFFHPGIPIAEREIRRELRGLNKAAREMKKAKKSSGTQDASEPVVIKPVGF